MDCSWIRNCDTASADRKSRPAADTGAFAYRKYVPPGKRHGTPTSCRAATSLVSRRRYLAQISLGIEAVRRAMAAACWMAMNWPESLLSLTSAYAWTIFGCPHTHPSRQPIMLKPFDIE